MTPNPPIKGHALFGEGFCGGRRFYWCDDDLVGGCECGAKPPGFPDVSRGKCRAWHRAHKADIRAAREAYALRPSPDLAERLRAGLVGDPGPETFTPGQNGTISPLGGAS